MDADQIRKWIAEGRADAQTRIVTEGAAVWTRLADVLEFADALAAKAPKASPDSMPPPIGAESAPPISSGPTFLIGDCFSRGWQLYKSEFWLLLVATAVMLLITSGLHSIPAVGNVLGLLFGFAFWGGLNFLFLKRIRGEAADVGDAFCGFKAGLVPLMLASLVANVLTTIGFFLIILPGIYLLVAWWMFVPLLIIDKRLEFWPAMELSRKTVNQNFWRCLGLFVLSGLVAISGFIACGVGMFFTVPIGLAAVVYAYEDLFGQRPIAALASTPTSDPTPPAMPDPAQVPPEPVIAKAEAVAPSVPTADPGTGAPPHPNQTASEPQQSVNYPATAS